jgi:branched-subunit amino acid ABC-type transport system permease component
MLLASLGVYVVGQNVISLAFGDSSRPLGESVISPGLAVFGARVTEAQLASIAVVAAVLMGFAVVMTTIGIGHQIQAVANDRELSEVVGISIAAIDGLVFTLGSAMAGLAGILWAIDQNMTPTMGMRALLIGVVAMIIGGQKTVSGVVLASMFLALAQNYSILFVPTAWQDAIVFLILVAFLLVSPSGFFGLRGRRRSLT